MRKILLLITLTALLLAGCGRPVSPPDGLQVVATTAIAGDVVRQVAGEMIDLTILLPVDADPHSFQPTPQDLARIAEADLIFINGLELEAYIDDILQNASSGTPVVTLAEGIQTLSPGSGDQSDGEGDDDHQYAVADPHIWMDPNNVVIWVDTILGAMTQLDPANQETYTANAAAYQQQLAELDRWISAQVETIPPTHRLLVSDHDTLAYFAARYGFELLGAVIPGYSTLAEPSAQDLARLEDAITDLGVPAVFVGTGVNPNLAERVAEDTGIQLVEIYTGSLSGPEGPAASYLEMMRYNVAAIVAALG